MQLLARQVVTRALTAVSTAWFADFPASATQPLPADAPVVIPLGLCGGAYCVSYRIDGQPFRAVVDTGSPFLLADGTCVPSASSVWGCYRGTGRDAGLENTDELFGGQDVGVEWRRGSFVLLSDMTASAGLASVDDAVFGVVRTYQGKGGSGALFLGLVKERQARIRPTLLEQTRVASMRFDFLRRTLELSPRPLIPTDSALAVRLLDLRRRGAPVAVYAARISRMYINDAAVELDRPALAVIDTGTTGVSVSEGFFGPCLGPGSFATQWRNTRIELATERGGVCTLEASVRRRPKQPSAGMPDVSSALPPDAPEYDEFPLVVSPTRVPWFEPGFGEAEGYVRRRNVFEALSMQSDGLGPADAQPHVLFVGMAFLWRRKLTIDVDARRLCIE
jgi:hypothetical protein